MTYIMQLHEAPFAAVKSGAKTIELRLNDEKRRRIKIGECITFLSRGDSAQSLTVRVTALHPFASFAELYQALPLDQCGYAEEELPSASPEDMNVYYTAEEIERYGVVGIEFELLN